MKLKIPAELLANAYYDLLVFFNHSQMVQFYVATPDYMQTWV